MQNTGIVRKVDTLGRLVIPKEIRKSLSIKDGEELEISIGNEEIILKKYKRLLNLKNTIEKYFKLLQENIDFAIIVVDREQYITTNYNTYFSLINTKISKELYNLIEERKEITGKNLKLNENIVLSYYYIKPIIINGDLFGALLNCSNKEISSQEKTTINILETLIKITFDID